MTEPRSVGTPHGALNAALAEQEDRLLACVHCGFCLTACPTYTRLGDENDSPRGRLYLMRAVVEGRLAAESEAFAEHIDRCLGCRACETVCPSGVQYGFLLERAREVSARARGMPWPTRVMLRIFRSTGLTAFVLWLGRALRSSGLVHGLVRSLPRRFSRVRFGLAMLGATRPWSGLRGAGGPPRRHGWKADESSATEEDAAETGGAGTQPPGSGGGSPAAHPTESVLDRARARADAVAVRGGPARRVAMLRGCVQHGLFRRVNVATAAVLRRNGCDVVAARGQACCGALHAHAGDLEGARELARRNVDAFSAPDTEAVIVNAAGCGAMMKEYGELLADEPLYAERARSLAARVRDVFEFLDETGARPGAPVRLEAAYDAPCHLYHAQRIHDAPMRVLADAVPGLRIRPLARFEECCGGAGIYGLMHPDLGGRILHDKVDDARDSGGDVVVTGNPGCIMQIGAGLLLEGDHRPVLHPIELLAESYRRDEREA